MNGRTIADGFDNVEWAYRKDTDKLEEALELDAAATRLVLDKSYPGLVAKYDESVDRMRKFDYKNLIQTTIDEDKNVIKEKKKMQNNLFKTTKE